MFNFLFHLLCQHLFRSHSPQTKTLSVFFLFTVIAPSSLPLLSVTVLMLVKVLQWKKLSWLLHFIFSLPSLFSALPFPSNPPTHSPAHHHFICWPGKVDYWEKMSYTLWREGTGCQLYMCHSAVIAHSLSPPTPSDSAEVNPLFSSLFYLSLGLTSVFYSTATSKHTHIHTQHPT